MDWRDPPFAPAKRRLRVAHRTTFTYGSSVARSSHRLHLRPMSDWRQTLLAHSLDVSPTAPILEHEDVFGNWTQSFELATPYWELILRASSIVEMTVVDPFALPAAFVGPTFPVAFMPWEQVMLAPYMKPDELPESQVRELHGHARAIAEANRGDVLETLFDINLRLFREYRYAPGTTTMTTTAYDVFAARSGVCQDFSNLFVMWARLLGLPARYVCGYLYTGGDASFRALADQTHAWVEVYVPGLGWRAFDPTNGVLPTKDHVCLARGRRPTDAAPTSGTVFGAVAGSESLRVEVRVEDCTPA